MSKEKLEAQIDNESEWRRFFIAELHTFRDEIKVDIKELKAEQKRQHGISQVLKTKIGVLGIMSGVIGSYISHAVSVLFKS